MRLMLTSAGGDPNLIVCVVITENGFWVREGSSAGQKAWGFRNTSDN